MKESKLIEMANRIEQLGSVAQQLIRTTEGLKTIVMGDHEVIKQLKEFPEIIKKMQEENGKKENNSGSTTGDSRSTTPDLELK